ncbi:D-hexose-6-phosphate mutarotase [Sulfurimonas sp.]|uniref:D-hexose-6-phosphate mutarotase n=1 Tax=Sulfurimonas sp. TaxID=2022749 RepID=UPI0025CC3182|nr:D-hexose-6-phosphate mutarotase [Sulfurimonas sp.]MBT5935847.1 D-hexose-6-phosphate mutarotase [Sulfurimonas sp.]
MYTLKKRENGFEYLELQNSVAHAKIALQGAHIFEYKREKEEDLLWLSTESFFEKGKAIRGGVPICWPRFGTLDESMPAHGFSRTAMFTLVEVLETKVDLTEVRFLLTGDEQSRKIWNHKFELEVIFSIGESLEIELKTKNCESEEFMITQALHSYFCVSDISHVKIKNLDKKPYFDALLGKTFFQKGDVTFEKEVDRVYQEVDTIVVLEDKKRVVHVQNSGSSSVVVWNPWCEKATRLAGMRDVDYKEFVCIESANAFDDFRVIKAGETHSLKVSLSTSSKTVL